jgi:hypothetical protein
MKIKELYQDPTKWCRGSFATDKDGKDAYRYPAESFSDDRRIINDDACRFCLLGAIAVCYNNGIVDPTLGSPFMEMVNKIKSTLSSGRSGNGFFSLAHLNDGSSHEEILALVMELDV